MPSSNGKTFTYFNRNTSMPETTILDVLDTMLQTDRTFIQALRFLPDERETLVASQQRNSASIILLLRSYLLSRGTEATFTIPIQFPLPLRSTVPVGPSTWSDPVIVHPTMQQISAATSVIGNASDENCAICQEIMEGPVTRINHCSHMFHPNCISEWFTRSVFCPNCRHDIRETGTPQVQTPPVRQTRVGRRRTISSLISSIAVDPSYQDFGTISFASTNDLPRANSPSAVSPLEESRISHTEDTEESDVHHV
jgi:hypothetical protein